MTNVWLIVIPSLPVLLLALAATLAMSGFRVFAQVQPPVGPTVPGLGVNGSAWILLASSAVAAAGSGITSWINSKESAERLRRELAEREVAEVTERLTAEIKAREAELKAAEEETRVAIRERDQWMRRAYSHGWKSSDEIPTRKDQP